MWKRQQTCNSVAAAASVLVLQAIPAMALFSSSELPKIGTMKKKKIFRHIKLMVA
jgi:hypothetical protein